MLILDLCGGSGAWSQPYRDAGYCVQVYDLLNGHDVRLLRRAHGVHGILAAPMCTTFSYARNRYPATDAELLKGLSLVDACIRIAYAHRNGLRWWALENPINLLRHYLGPPVLTFRQWEYGDPGEKPTGIWGDFTPPPKHPKPRTKSSTFGTSRQNADPADAITPPNFARAFFEANP